MTRTTIDSAQSSPAASTQSYDTLTQAIHWLSLAALAAAVATGWTMEDAPRGAEKALAVNLHASFGVLVMALTAVRLGWRAVAPSPEPVPGQPMLQLGAKAMHLALYGLLVAIPVTGVLMMSAKGQTFDVFGLFNVSPLIAPDRGFGKSLEEVHETLANLMLWLVGLHTAAAILHQTILGDGMLSRMLPFGPTTRARS